MTNGSKFTIYKCVHSLHDNTVFQNEPVEKTACYKKKFWKCPISHTQNLIKRNLAFLVEESYFFIKFGVLFSVLSFMRLDDCTIQGVAHLIPKTFCDFHYNGA